MSHDSTVDYNPSGDETEVLELEPTLGPEAPMPSAAPRGLVGAGPASFGGETEDLLRDRLRSTAWFVATTYAVLLLFNLLVRRAGIPAIPLGNAAAIVLSLGLFLVLRRAEGLRLDQLRRLELTYFGGMLLIIAAVQYFANREYLTRGDFVSAIAYEKTGVLNVALLMFLYGALIPNHPRRTARVVLTMSVVPILVLAVLLEREEFARPDQLETTRRQAVINSIQLLMCAVVAIYVARILNGLRRELHEAQQLGQYRLGSRLGAGGMGEVYLAEHQFLKRPCALKLIKADVQNNPIAIARFEREVMSAARLTHPNTIEIFDYGHTPNGTFYYVMEYLPGLSVGDLIAQFGPLPPGRAVYLMGQVCGALGEAHRLGLIHRDLKPANIIVAILGGACDIAKVLDFGLVKVTGDPDAPQLTADYTVSGTPAFMSPEQARGTGTLDGRSDLYAAGAVLYCMLTGRPPFDGDSAMDLMIAHARDPVTPPSKHRPGIPADLEAVVLRCLAKSPDDRYPDARAMAEALAACACAADWDQRQAEQWWTAQAERHLQAPAAPRAATTEAVPAG